MPLTQTEFRIVSLLWEHDAMTVREIAEAIYQSSDDSKTASVQKLLRRLSDKDCVDRLDGCRPHRYHARVSRGEHVRGQLRSLADQHFGGRLAALATTIIRDAGITAEQRQELRELINQQWPDEPQS